MKIGKIFVALAFILSLQVQAGGYLGIGNILVMQNAYGGWIMTLSGENSDPDNCGSPTAILEPTHSQYKEIFSLLLSAYTTNKKVNVNVNGCHSSGYKKLLFVYTNWNT